MTDRTATAAELLYREARCLDERRWDDWLALYDDAAEFWVPAWKGEHEPTDDPAREVSLIYTATRRALEERVWRVRSGQSIASMPLPRTAHAVSNVLVAPAARVEIMAVSSVATTHVYNVKRREQHVSFALAEHRLALNAGVWRIRRKKLILLNDYLPTMLDFYTI
ncbi:MAG TPA: aromatic-ring-hydroxylating dioxygenase subunit beta [Stellaceae bacterium]|nr:aromatic-ring-hydroxylating dioxygenase subunit beta [Stellaceae bacterium]